MMSPPTPPTTPASGRPNLAALFGKSLRLAVILVLVAAGLLLLQTFREMLHETPAAPPPATANRADADVAMPDFLQPGAWSLGGSNWTVALIDLASPDGEARLRSLGFRGTLDDKASSLEQQVLTWLKQSRPTVTDGCRVYDVSAGAIRLRAVTRTQGGSERLQLAQAMWRRGESMQMLEAVPAPSITSGGGNETHLLPLPAGVPSLARRWASSGALTCEILGPTTRGEAMLKEWADAGWSVIQPPDADASSPRELRKGDRVVHFCSLPSGQGSGDYLLLTVEPAQKQGAN
jgi:hypothetical protein